MPTKKAKKKATVKKVVDGFRFTHADITAFHGIVSQRSGYVTQAEGLRGLLERNPDAPHFVLSPSK